MKYMPVPIPFLWRPFFGCKSNVDCRIFFLELQRMILLVTLNNSNQEIDIFEYISF